MVNFISVPLKQTNEVDLIRPLSAYIDSLTEFSADLKTETNEAIVELNKLRNRACVQPLDKHQTSLDTVTRYYDQLCVMDSKLPISPTQNPISFKWKDAFDKGSLFFSRASLTINDSSFERAAVLFNCGALMSTVAAAQHTNTDDELKSIAKLFQQSAGVFTKLKDSVLGLVQQDPTPDLMPDTLSALSALMLAQAQEAIYVKAAKDQMKPSALVKISSQCAEFYQDAQKVMTREVVKGIWDKDWLQTVSGKSFVYAALGQYHQSQISASEKQIGEQITRLREAQRLMELANSYVPLTTNFPVESAAVKKALEQANKDNDFIYHERVPDFKSLPPLPKAALAKPLPVIVPISPKFRDLFESLVPVSIQNALSLFEARKSDVVNMETGRMREYTQIMNACLASLNLPAALDDVKNHEKCPESIRQKSAKVKSSGGVNSIRTKLRELPSLYKRNEEILDEIYRLLKDEKENDDSLRSQFNDKWTRVPSDRLTVPLTQELGKYRGILHTATNADAIVSQKFDANAKGIEILSKTESELIASIPGLKTSTNHENSEAVQKLNSLMGQVQQLKVERENLEKQLKGVKFDMCNDFLKSYSDNGVVNEEKISSDKIQELFHPLKQNVEQSLKRQEGVLADIQTWNKKFCEEKHGSGSEDRENFLKLLATAYDAFFSLEENLNEGTKFYNDLTPILVRLQQKVSDFCFARKTEKEDLMKQVQQNIVSGGDKNSGGAATKAPPPRPPPPAATSSNAPSTASAPQSNFSPQNQQLWNSMSYQQVLDPIKHLRNMLSTTLGRAMPSIPLHQQQPSPYSQQPQQQNQQGGYAQNPQPNPYMPYGGMAPGYHPPQFPQNYSTPYPVQYPTSYPGGPFPPQPPNQQQQQAYYGQYPPQPQFGQQHPGNNPSAPR